MLNETYRAMLNNKSVIRETFMYGRQRAAQIGNENVFDYSLGNPSVPCPPEFTEAMQTLLAQEEPVSLHGYCPSQGDPGFRTAVAAHLTETFGLPYAQKHIFPTTGAAGAIAHAIRAVTQPGDEVLTFAPYFPEYGPYVAGTGAVLRVVPPQAPTFQPNLDAFAQMLTEKVTCVLINTPNNPTGVVYSADTLTRMAAILTEKSAQYGHNIFLVSDEPYRDIVFDGKTVPYPAAFYPHTLTCFSYSKSLSLPGERLGYVVVLIIICAAALAAVVLYNLISVNLGERKKELATIKVLGFYDQEVYRYIFREIELLALIGSGVGLALGVPLHKFIVLTVEMDQLMFIRTIAPRSYLLAVALTMVFTVVVCFVMRRHVRRISMVESMKAPE